MQTKRHYFTRCSSITLILMAGCGPVGGTLLDVGRCPAGPVTVGEPISVDLLSYDLLDTRLWIDDASVQSSTNAEVAAPERQSAFDFTAKITPLEAGAVEVIFAADVAGGELTARCSFVAVDATD